MVYITARKKAIEKQLSWLDLLDGADYGNYLSSDGSAQTVTRLVDRPNEELLKKVFPADMRDVLKSFNERHKDLFERDRNSMYAKFYIPKKTGGLREIDAPCDELQNALRELKGILEDRFGLLYHTSAFAYVPNRCITDAVRRHQANESNWFLKTDFSKFFPSTTLEFTMRMLSMIFPISELVQYEDGKAQLEKALSLAFLNGGLPQGTVISPMLSNVVMIPIDHKLTKELAAHKYVYTRYADDIHISCVQRFNPDKIVDLIRETCKEFGAPYTIKDEKTHYGSRKGKNFMLGLMLNKENAVTVG